MPETLTDAQKVLRNDTGKRIAAALETLASGVEPSTVIAPEYDATQTYAVGDLVIYRSVLYRCTTAITTPEEWTAAHWTAVTVADELADKYVKPTGGIPKNDLAAGVQESLDKADTALQQHQSLAAYRTAAAQDVIDANLMALGLTGASVGDLVRVAAVDANGRPTSWKKAPLCEIRTNPNLLDNWYFVGGGSQRTDVSGAFPINQRGQTYYANPGYTIDRWYLNGSGQAMAIASTNDEIIIGTNSELGQKIENGYSNLVGKIVTLSVLTTTSLVEVTGVVASSGISVSKDFEGKQMYIDSGNGNQSYITVVIKNIDSDGQFKAVKMELGSEQTLAHQENGQWVLNEIPDYETELIKCKTSTADPTDIYANKTIGYNVSNRNLLDNWYFVNPVNQRGLSIYNITNSREMSIDRWFGYDGRQAGKIEVTSDGVSITKTSGGDGIYFGQKLEQDLTGETATFTVLTSTGTLFTGSAVIANNVAFISAWPNIRGLALIENGRTVIQIYVYAASLTIKAAKLELGSEQTLAHQENGQWVLNEIPDYAEQWRKCRRYYSVIKNSSNTMAVFLGNVIPYSDDSILSMDIDLAGAPTVRVTGLKLSDVNYTAGVDATYTVGYTSGRLDFFINSPGVTAGKAYRVLAQAGTSVEIEVP